MGVIPYSTGITEIDASVLRSADRTIVGFVGPASKGPVSGSTLLRSEQDLERTYGLELSGYDAIALARQALRSGTRVRFSRTTATDVGNATEAVKASCGITAAVAAQPARIYSGDETVDVTEGSSISFTVNGGAPQVENIGAFTRPWVSGVAGPYNLDAVKDGDNEVAFSFKVNDGSTITLTIDLDDAGFSDDTAVTAAELELLLNADPLAVGVEFDDNAGTFRFRSTRIGSSSSTQAVASALVTAATISTTKVDGDGFAADFSVATPQEFHNYFAANPVTGATSSYDSGTGRWILATIATGAAASLSINPSVSYFSVWGWSDPETDSGNAAATRVIMRISGATEGTWAHDASVTVSAATDGNAAHFNLLITSPGLGIPNASFTNVSADDISELRSMHFTFDNSESDDEDLVPASLRRPTNGVYAFSGGTNGTSGITHTELLGNSALGSGIYVIGQEGDLIDVYVPDVTDSVARQIVKNTAESSQIVFYLDGPKNIAPDEFLDYRRAESSYSSDTIINSSWIVYTAGQLEYNDALGASGATRFYNALGGFAGVLGVNDFVRKSNAGDPGPHLAPSGPNRGATQAFSARHDLTGASYAAMREAYAENGINWIEVQDGVIMVRGNVTASLDSKLTSNLNVRRMLADLYRALRPIFSSMQDEPNDTVMWRDAYRKVKPILDRRKANRAIQDFRIYFDQNAKSIETATLNTPETVAAGRFIGQLALIPTPGARAIDITVVVTSSLISFSES